MYFVVNTINVNIIEKFVMNPLEIIINMTTTRNNTAAIIPWPTYTTTRADTTTSINLTDT